MMHGAWWCVVVLTVPKQEANVLARIKWYHQIEENRENFMKMEGDWNKVEKTVKL